MRTTTLLLVAVVAVVVLALLFLGRGDQARLARVLRLTGFGLLAAETVFFALFAGGEALSDPGGWKAVGLIAAWLVPLVVLALLAWQRPDVAVWVLGVLTAVVVAAGIWFAIDPQGWRNVENDVGPVRAIAVFVVVAALGVLGLTRTMPAGVLLLVTGLAPLLLGLSRGGLSSLAAVGTPATLVGALYVASAVAGSRPSAARRRTPAGRPG